MRIGGEGEFQAFLGPSEASRGLWPPPQLPLNHLLEAGGTNAEGGDDDRPSALDAA